MFGCGSGVEVFDFFDDFIGSILDSQKWKIGGKSYSLSNSKISLCASPQVSLKSVSTVDEILEYPDFMLVVKLVSNSSNVVFDVGFDGVYYHYENGNCGLCIDGEFVSSESYNIQESSLEGIISFSVFRANGTICLCDGLRGNVRMWNIQPFSLGSIYLGVFSGEVTIDYLFLYGLHDGLNVKILKYQYQEFDPLYFESDFGLPGSPVFPDRPST